jgi:hypothetical protein
VNTFHGWAEALVQTLAEEREEHRRRGEALRQRYGPPRERPSPPDEEVELEEPWEWEWDSGDEKYQEPWLEIEREVGRYLDVMDLCRDGERE